MSKIIVLICIIISIHALYNLINFLRYNYIKNIFTGFFSKDPTVNHRSLSLKNTVLNYIKNAGVSDKRVAISQPTGYGLIANSTISIFENISNRRQDLAFTAYELLLEAKGNYWSRFINSINPIYWLKIIIFIPKYILSYLGLNNESSIIKIVQLLYWFLGIIFTFSIAVFPNEIKEFILSFIN